MVFLNIENLERFSGITADSRHVKPGFLFAVVPGTAQHGLIYLGQAIEKGALGILAEPVICAQAHQQYPDLICWETQNVRKHLAQLAAHFYPHAPLFRAAVTGTNGKSSVVGFTRQLWGMLEKKAASLGTLGLELSFPSNTAFTPLPALTTPDAVSLHRCLEELKTQENIDYLVLEAASHGLDQYRLDGASFHAGAFTSFSRDHLDYHKDEKTYFQAKSRLFEQLILQKGKAILCADDPKILQLHSLAENRGLEVWTYGKKGNTLRILSWQPSSQGQVAVLALWGETIEVTLPLLGFIQLQNILAALAITVASGATLKEILPCLPLLKGIKGRLEFVGCTPRGGSLYVDYAHTPDALRLALQTLRAHTPGKLGVVFGCGGDRDMGKRIEMGKIAGETADWVIVTDDNPRREDPAFIRQAILQGCPNAREIGNRAQAIAHAIESLGPGDIGLVAGKGHEIGQIVEDTIFPFEDQKVIQSLLHQERKTP